VVREQRAQARLGTAAPRLSYAGLRGGPVPPRGRAARMALRTQGRAPPADPDRSWCWPVPRWTPVSRERGTGRAGRLHVVRHRDAGAGRTRDRAGLHGPPPGSRRRPPARLLRPEVGETWVRRRGTGRPDRARRVDLRLPGGSARCTRSAVGGRSRRDAYRGEVGPAAGGAPSEAVPGGAGTNWWSSEIEASVAAPRGRGEPVSGCSGRGGGRRPAAGCRGRAAASARRTRRRAR
jgi:hypothetical protein